MLSTNNTQQLEKSMPRMLSTHGKKKNYVNLELGTVKQRN